MAEGSMSPRMINLSRKCRTERPLSPLRKLMKALGAEGELADREGRMADASRCYLDTIRLGYGISRGGHMVDWLTGGVFLTSGAESLHKNRFKLESDHCTELANRMLQLEGQAESWTDIRDRNAAYDYLWGGWQDRVS